MTREIGNAVLSSLLNRTRTTSTLRYPEALGHGAGNFNFLRSPLPSPSSAGEPRERDVMYLSINARADPLTIRWIS